MSGLTAAVSILTRTVAVLAAVLLLGCTVGLQGPTPSTLAPASGSPVQPTASAGTSAAPPSGGTGEPYVAVEFASRAGPLLAGRLYEADGPAVVLSHMGRPRDSQRDWEPAALMLAEAGFEVLTYNRSGVCDSPGVACSEGFDRLDTTWQEVLGAVDYLRGRGHERVFVGGASIGAMASLHAARTEGEHLAGVIWFAGILRGSGYHFDEPGVSHIECPKLLMSGDRDGRSATQLPNLFGWLTEPKRQLLVSSSRHGTDIIKDGGPMADQVLAALLDFVETHSAMETPCGTSAG